MKGMSHSPVMETGACSRRVAMSRMATLVPRLKASRRLSGEKVA
jgi:hypothetical protein